MMMMDQKHTNVISHVVLMNQQAEQNLVKKKFNLFIKVLNKNVRPVRFPSSLPQKQILFFSLTGIVNEETFKHIYGQFFPFADTSSYAHLVFSTFDIRSSGCVTFEDFLVCLSTLCRGSIEDRLRWIFQLYDTKKSGKLTREVNKKEFLFRLNIFCFLQDFHLIICAVYSLLGNVSSPRYDLETTREHTATVFQRFDKLHQGYITIQDFMSFCLNVNEKIL